MDLPIQAPAAGLDWNPRPQGSTVLVTGAAGTVASLISQQLSKSYSLIGIDIVPIDDPAFADTHQASLDDEALLNRLVQTADFVVHLATGAPEGKHGLYATEIDATNRILASAIAHGTRRVVLASSNHAAGWPERERSEEHTSELQSRGHLVCRLLLEKKKTSNNLALHQMQQTP